VRRRQAGLQPQVEARGARVVGSVDTLANVLFVEAANAEVLAGLPGVKRVLPDRELQLFMDRAVITHRVTQAWEQIGGQAKAGEGIKIGILDTGIDPDHPGFAAGDLKAPDGYPKASPVNLPYTSGKIIAARSYGQAVDVRDSLGHGTAVAFCAAGVQHDGVIGPLSGVAPRAWLGVYRVDNPATGGIPTSSALSALEDAYNDGMDVINMSFGSLGTAGASEDILALSSQTLTAAGVVVVNAAGNTTGPMTVDDTAANTRILAVGATQNDRAIVQPSVVPSQGAAARAYASSNAGNAKPVVGGLVDVSPIDPLGCTAYPPDFSLQGKIPLIRRGTCNFSVKLANAAAAGAAAAVVYNRPDADDPEALVTMDVSDNPTIPGDFVAYSDGVRLKGLIATVEDLQVQLRFGRVPLDTNVVTSWSSRGPSVELAIKPDLSATGTWVYTAAKRAAYSSTSCPVCDPSGYALEDGTSFAAPIVAGAAAVLKSARSGLEGDDYRSLLVTTARRLDDSAGRMLPVQTAGSGSLNLWAALNSTVSAVPWSVSFQAGSGTMDLSRAISLKNLSSDTNTLMLAVDSPNDAKPSLSTDTLTLAPGETGKVTVALSASGLAAGVYEGAVRVTSSANGVETRIPYWYAVQGDGTPAAIDYYIPTSSGQISSELRVYLRVHDSSGLAVTGTTPVVVPVTPGGAVTGAARRDDSFGPNLWRVSVQLGPASGTYTFRAQAGDATATFQVTAR
jgi:subtilisin family serine protease